MKNERTHKRLYLLECLLLGVPGLIVSGLVIGFVLLMAVIDPGFEHDNRSLMAFAWSMTGLAGVIAWVWLSWLYLRRGRSALQETPAFPWLMLMLGVAAALPALAVSIKVLLAEAYGLMRALRFDFPIGRYFSCHWRAGRCCCRRRIWLGCVVGIASPHKAERRPDLLQKPFSGTFATLS
ncbi:hypothetical protein [Stenotrophomonas sp.]|uniref:hypothetical protein n=1 Tax=Stenotrophomonas sp. TaxID=69392 RepID=UPI0028A8E7F0|nr:hypothetical protein [Stenotrophomonas sp.]